MEEKEPDVEMEESWDPDDEIRTGCALLDRFLKRVLEMNWDATLKHSPWKNIWEAGMNIIFGIPGISEGTLNVILSVLNW